MPEAEIEPTIAEQKTAVQPAVGPLKILEFSTEIVQKSSINHRANLELKSIIYA